MPTTQTVSTWCLTVRVIGVSAPVQMATMLESVDSPVRSSHLVSVSVERIQPAKWELSIQNVKVLCVSVHQGTTPPIMILNVAVPDWVKPHAMNLRIVPHTLVTPPVRKGFAAAW